jgi:hypothetical protein
MAPVERKSDHRGRLLLGYAGVAAALFGREFKAGLAIRAAMWPTWPTEITDAPAIAPIVMPDARAEQLPMAFPRPGQPSP